MKLEEITEEGFYWNRLDEHREWSIVLVVRCARNPLHPMYNQYKVGYKLDIPSGWCSSFGEFIGPIEIPN